MNNWLSLIVKIGLALFCIISSTIFPLPCASQEAQLYGARSEIRLPEGCAHVAHEGRLNKADICASTLEGLQKEIEKNSTLKQQCGDLPDLSQAAVGGNLEGKLGFLPLGPGHFLIKIMCGEGAYNASWLVFAYDEIAQTSATSTPPLLLFPDNSAKSSPPDFIKTPFLRAFDAHKAILYHYRKMLGDGSGGYYAEYKIDRKNFIPALIKSIYKADADHQNGYNFQFGKRPQGGSWKILKTDPSLQGCLVKLSEISETASCQANLK